MTDGTSQTLMVGERQNGPFRGGAAHGNHFEYETTWAGAVRDLDDPTNDHGPMVLFPSGPTPNSPQSDGRDVLAAHGGQSLFLLRDDLIHAIQEEIDLEFFLALSTMAGEEIIGKLN